MLTEKRKREIASIVDRYVRRNPDYRDSPFVARHERRLAKVANKIGVPTDELDEFLTEINKELPPVVCD